LVIIIIIIIIGTIRFEIGKNIMERSINVICVVDVVVVVISIETG
jgi:hypothetical protein